MPAPIPPPAPWTAIVVRVPQPVDAIEESLVGLLVWCLEGQQRAGAELRFYLHAAHQADAALDQASALLRRSGLDPKACGLRAEVVEDGRWVERYQASLQPFDLGSRYRVWPTGRVDPSADTGDRRPLLLVPGRAFGTGEHPTTRLCVTTLEQRVVPGSRWVDIGCGTSILSMVARDCGASAVLGVDVDPEAIDVAREVLQANRRDATADRAIAVDAIDVRCGSVGDVSSGDWDGAIVNISAVFTIEAAGELAALPRAGGLLIVSGFMFEALPRVRAALEARGVAFVESAHEAPWGLAVFARPERGRD